MKLLIFTQKIDVNDDVLGFFHDWVKEFARSCEKVIVICLEKGEFHLPGNVLVLSLGKELGKSRLKYIFNFYKYIFQERKNYDSVFVHMNFEYVILGGIIWRLFNKKIGLWYAHGYVPFGLKLAARLADTIFTSTRDGFRIKSKKIKIVGQGINTEIFRIREPKIRQGEFKIISVGRIAPVKNYELLIETAQNMIKRGFENFSIRITGPLILERDKIYFEKLKNIIKEKKLEDKIIFTEAIPYKDIFEFYQSGDLFVNFSDTGSMDKAVLEAMAAGLLVLTSNEAFKNILAEKYFTGKDPEEISEKIIVLSKINFDPSLCDYVVKNHSLDQLISNLTSLIKLS